MELKEYEWELLEVQHDGTETWHAGGSAHTFQEAEREALHYLSQYANDDTGMRFEVFETTRKSLGGMARYPAA